MSKFTPGPWRWEINREAKILHLVGGVPQFDLTVMDFSRWGMRRAVPRFRDTSLDGMNLMDRLCDKPEWIADFPGRSHHKEWCAAVTHPDAVLMAAAPDLLEALTPFVVANSSEELVTIVVRSADITKARAAIQKAIGETP